MKMLKWFALVLMLVVSPKIMAAEEEIDVTMLEVGRPFEVVYGDVSAPVRIVEYASLSCGHCKQFYEKTFTPLKKEYVDTGKVVFIYRHFPLNAPAFRATQLLSCVADEARQKIFLRALFRSQEEWGFEADETVFLEKLQMLGKIGGLSGDEMLACFDDKEQEEALLAEIQLAAGKLKIGGTPTIFINDAKAVNGSFEGLKTAIDALLATK